jgi:hypothetical protein
MGTRLKDLQGIGTNTGLMHAAEAFAEHLMKLPDSREKSLALTKLDEALLWTNQCLDVDRYAGSPKYDPALAGATEDPA